MTDISYRTILHKVDHQPYSSRMCQQILTFQLKLGANRNKFRFGRIVFIVYCIEDSNAHAFAHCETGIS